MTSIFSVPNDRVFYACIGVFFRERQTTQTGGDSNLSGTIFLDGVQSVGIDSSFPKTSYLDIGRAQRVHSSYDKQEFTINIERNIPYETGRADDENTGTFYTSAGTSYEATHILNDDNIGSAGFENSLRNYDIVLVYAPDRIDTLGGGTSGSDVDKNKFMATIYRCCLLTSMSYNIAVNGPVTETLTFTTRVANQIDASSLNWSTLSLPDNGAAVTGKVLKRDHIDTTNSVLPTEVTRMFNLGTSDKGLPVLGLQNIEIAASINYSDMLDVGQWRGSNLSGGSMSKALTSDPAKTITESAGSDAKRAEENLYRQVILPVEVTASFTGVARTQYRAGGYQDFELDNDTFSDTEIAIATLALADGGTKRVQWNLGKKNYLTDISYTGGDTGGGNVEATLSFQNDRSDFVVLENASVLSIDPGSTVY